MTTRRPLWKTAAVFALKALALATLAGWPFSMNWFARLLGF